MLLWFLLCGVVQSQVPLTGTIRTFTSSPGDSGTLSPVTVTAGLALNQLANGRPAFTRPDYAPLFSLDSPNTLAYTIPVSSIGSGLLQFSAEPFYSASQLFTFELEMDISNATLAGKTLQFNSGGDLWVYFGYRNNASRIGGRLAVDLGGPHDKLAADSSLIWDTWMSANLVPNNAVVRMYVFYAHRTSNTPHLKITFANQMECSAETVGVLVPNLNLSALDTATGFGSSKTQNISGEKTLILLANTSLGGQYEAAYAWFPKIQRITSGFVTQFEYLLSGSPNGFAFVFQNYNRQTSSVGGGGINLGYAGQGFTNQAAIEFDVYGDGGGDVANKIELHTKYGAENSALPTTPEVTVTTPYTGGPLASAVWTPIIISYAPTGILSVWMNDLLVYQATINHTRVLNEIGENVFFGFTTSNGPNAYPNNVYIRKWRLWTTPLSGLRSTATNTTGTWNMPRANDNDGTADLYVTTRDPCDRQINTFGLTVPFAVSIIMGPAGSARFTSAGGGRYNLFYHNTLTGNYTLSVSFDGQQIAGSPFPITVVADVVSQYSTFNVTAGLNGANVIASHPITLVVAARDRFSNLNFESPAYPFLANWATESSSPAVVTTAPYYTVNLTTVIGSEPISRGVFVTYNGNPLVSNFSAVVVADVVDADKTQFDLPGGQFQSIVAGTQARMTIIPYDEYRNRIFTNPGGEIDFSMNLPGPIIVRNNTPILWTTNLTYAPFPHWEFMFSATSAGRYTFYITYAGSLVFNTGVSPVVVAGPIAKAKLDHVPTTLVASLGGGFTILTQDVYENLRTDPSDRPLIVMLNGVNTTCGNTATLTNGSGVINFGCSYQGSFSGRYQVSFIPTLQQFLNASFFLDGVKLPTNASISVVSGPPDPTTSNITSASNLIVAGTTGTLVVVLKDAQGNLVLGRADQIKTGLLFVHISGTSSQSASLTLNSTTESSAGTYTISFSASLAGKLVWGASISGNAQSIVSSDMVETNVVPGPPDPAHFVISGSGLASQQVINSFGQVDVALRDRYDNVISGTNLTSDFSVTLNPSTGTPTINFVAGTAAEYHIQFKNPPSGGITLNVTISFTGIVIKGGNFSVRSVNTGTTNATCIPGSPNVSVAGAYLSIMIADIDTYESYNSQPPVFSADYSSTLSKTQAQTVTPPTNVSSNIWTVIFQNAPTKVGVYNLSIFLNGQPSTLCAPCNTSCFLTIVPSVPAVGFSRLDATDNTGVVGTGVYVNITVKDAFDNLILTQPNLTVRSSTNTSFTDYNWAAPGVLTVLATTFVATPWEMQVYFGVSLIASRVFVSLAGPPATGYIVDFAANGTSQGVAGLPYSPSAGFRGYCLVAQDRYNQPVTDTYYNNKFTMNIQPHSGSYPVTLESTLTTSFDGTPCFQLVFTPTVINSVGLTPFQLSYNSMMLVNVSSAIFVPGAVNVSNVRVYGLSDTYIATNAFQFAVLLVDSYGNNITSNADPVYGAIGSLPARGRIIGPITGGFQSPLWGFVYPGTLGSPGELTYAGNWTITLTYKGNGLLLGPSNGFPNLINVNPGPTVPIKTVISLPVISSNDVLNNTKGLVAGDMGNWSFALFDKFLNPTLGVNTDNVTVAFLEGVRTFSLCDPASVSLPSNANLINDAAGISVTMQADGRGTMYSTKARKVVMFLQVNGQYIYSGPCTNVQEAFPVHPADEDATNTLISGPGLDGGVAGSFLSFVVILRDRFNNSVNRGGANVTFGPNNESSCLATYPNVLTVVNQSSIEDRDNGTYTATFQTTEAQKFLLQVSIDGALAGSATSCTIVVVSPWYADSATHSAQSMPVVVRAGLPVSVQIQGRDIYGNVVTNQAFFHEHYFLTSVDRELQCRMYVKRTTSASTASINNAGAPWVGLNGGTGCVSGPDLRALAAQTLRSAIDSCFLNCTANCTQLKSLNDAELYTAASTAAIGDGNLACAIFEDNTLNASSLDYHIDSSTANCPVEPCYANSSITLDSQTAFFIPEYPGQYHGYFLLQPDPTCVGCTPHFPTTNVNFQIDPATCEQVNASTPYRCANGSCHASRSDCLETCPAFNCFDGCSSTPCSCPSGSFQCAGTSHCVESAALCPAADAQASVCPTGTTLCWSGVCTPSAQCPSKRACPPSFVMCVDGQTCVRNISDCGSVPPCATGFFQCQNGYCVKDGESCPSVPTCPSGVLCPDGSCRASAADCADVAPCYAPLSFRCADGACRARSSDCSTGVTCPLGLMLCPNGACSSICTTLVANCSGGNILCSDGSCQNNEGLCPTRTTCTADRPVLCPDGSCVASVWLCAQPASCNKTLCSNGFCADSASHCPTTVTCPFTAPVKCPDGQCQTDARNCKLQPECPYVTCPDGSCRRDYEDCPSMSTCPSSTPVRCSDGSCQAGAYACPLPSCGSFFRCPGGECMETKSQCPSRATCPPNMQRCVDGSCRISCASVTVARCPAGQIVCPQGAYGQTCATDISRCPYAATCPPDRPVRCLDASCVFAAKDCISTSSLSVDKTACADGGWASNGADNCYSGVTCPPWSPVKCWDNTCRQLVEDCPLQAPCPISLGGRYLCSDGTCARTLDLCASRGTRCAAGMIKCPTGSCAASPALCPNATATSCPDQATLCMDGSCRRTPSIWCRPLLCPLHAPYLCDNGACVLDVTRCPKLNGCPYDRPIKCQADGSCVASSASCPTPDVCVNGTYLCLDGTGCSVDCGCNSTTPGCVAPQPNGCKSPGFIRCHDGLCKPYYYCTGIAPKVTLDVDVLPGFAGSNLCPMNKPFRCPDGLCAVSLARCPVFPAPATPPCPNINPYLCANGMCVRSGAECPVLVDCPKQNGIKRCPNGHCDTICPPVNTCPTTQNHRCENGMCVASAAMCVNHTHNNCPTNQTICPDGHCRGVGSPCPAIRQSDGCATGTTKCVDGSCQATCARMQRCPASHPYICSGTCSVDPCVGGKMSNGCDITTPIRCADGQCKKYPSYLKNQTSDRCSPTLVCDGLRPVLCGDGTCVALAKHCRPIVCSTTLCPDGNCSSSCSALTTCPSAQPVLCPDGSCRSTVARCTSRLVTPCAASTPHQCWDGSCKSSLLECAMQTARLMSVSFNATELAASICPSGIMCPNGMCGLVAQDCDIVPRCPYLAPYRCWNGGCYASLANCPAKVDCKDTSLTRCEDGLCRRTCLAYDGCPLSSPYMCPGRAVMCVQNSTYCDSQPQVACSSNCNRDVVAFKQSVSIVRNRDTIIEVGLQNNLPRLRITFPAGAFQGDSPALVDIEPAKISHLPLSARVISTPFVVQSQSQLALDLSVDADIDWKRYESSSSSTAAQAAISCELQASYEITTPYVDASGAKGTCTGQANITTDKVELRQDASGTACAAFEQKLVFTNQTMITPWNEATLVSVSCVCGNTPNMTNVCYRAVRNRTQVTMSAYTNGFPGCPTAEEVTVGTNVITYNFNPAQNAVDACYLIVRAAYFADVDICLGVLIGDRFRCMETRANRVERDWNSPFDQPGVRRIGRVTSLGQVYAFVYSPLPPDDVIYIAPVTWWQLYGTTTLGTAIPFGLLFILAAIILFYFNRFRRKYKLEKEHMDHLKDQQAELDQFAGGLGMSDEGGEYDMVANPMVIEIEALQKQVETVNDALHGQAEEDAAEIDALELERQQLFAEIQRVKAAIADNEKAKAPKRVVEAPSQGYEAPTVPGASAGTKTVRRADFGQVRTTRKPKDIS